MILIGNIIICDLLKIIEGFKGEFVVKQKRNNFTDFILVQPKNFKKLSPFCYHFIRHVRLIKALFMRNMNKAYREISVTHGFFNHYFDLKKKTLITNSCNLVRNIPEISVLNPLFLKML